MQENVVNDHVDLAFFHRDILNLRNQFGVLNGLVRFAGNQVLRKVRVAHCVLQVVIVRDLEDYVEEFVRF